MTGQWFLMLVILYCVGSEGRVAGGGPLVEETEDSRTVCLRPKCKTRVRVSLADAF